jgi:hypothetical protein
VAAPSLTYTLTNGSTADASQVMQDLNDLLNGITDGTKDLTISALTCAGNASFQGNVTLGNGSVDDITFSGSLASSVPIKTNNSYDFGSSTLGLAGVYLGASGGFTTRVISSATSSFTLTLPPTGGTAGYRVRTNGSGALSFVANDASGVSNYGLSASMSSSALTIALKGADGNDPSSTNPVDIFHRNATAATGTPTITTVTSAASIVVPSTATLGHGNGVNGYIYVYLIMGSSNEIAVCGTQIIDEGALQSATAITTGADDSATLYATSNHTSKPVRLLGRMKSNQATAGTWSTAISEISLVPFWTAQVYLYAHSTTQSLSDGATNIIIYGTEAYDSHSAYDNTTGIFTCPLPGKYRVTAGVGISGATSTAAGASYNMYVQKNGSNDKHLQAFTYQVTGTTLAPNFSGSVTLLCAVNDTLKINVGKDADIDSSSLTAGSTFNFLMIERLPD